MVLRFWLLPLVCAGCTQAVDNDEREPRPTPPARSAEITRPNWPARAELDRVVRARYDERARAQIARSPVPVLAPPAADFASRTIVSVGDQFVALSRASSGITVSIHATRLAYRYASIPAVRGNRALRGGTGFVTQNEGIWSASWIEHGVAYALDVECADFRDRRCADDRFVTEQVRALAYVGGRGE